MSIDTLKGLGPKSQAMLASIGIEEDVQLLAADPFEIYRDLKLNGVSVSLNLLYALIGAQQNCHWQKVKKEQKTEILFRLDDMGLAPKK